MARHIEKPRYTCALGGALATANALPRTIPILHSSIGCGGNLSNAIGPAAGNAGSFLMSGYASPCSAVGEKEVVFGGDQRLSEQIRATLEITDADLYLVLTGCVVEMVGDDVESTVREFADDESSLIAVSTGGFKGNALIGYDLVLQALFTKYLTRNLPKQKGLVNVWGIPPAHDVFWEGNLLEIRRLLEKEGLSVNTFFTAKDDLESIRHAGAAELNLVLSPLHGLAAAQLFEREHDTPFLALDFPIGAQASGRFLRKVGEALNVERSRVESVITEEEHTYFRFFARAMDVYNDIDLQRYAVIIGNATYAFALAAFAYRELGWLPELIVINDILDDGEKDRLRVEFDALVPELAGKLVFETDTGRIIEHLSRAWPRPSGERFYRPMSPAFVIGSSIDNDLADAIGASHLAVTYPVTNRQVFDRATAGYRGGLSLTEDLFSVILSSR